MKNSFKIITIVVIASFMLQGCSSNIQKILPGQYKGKETYTTQQMHIEDNENGNIGQWIDVKAPLLEKGTEKIEVEERYRINSIKIYKNYQDAEIEKEYASYVEMLNGVEPIWDFSKIINSPIIVADISIENKKVEEDILLSNFQLTEKSKDNIAQPICYPNYNSTKKYDKRDSAFWHINIPKGKTETIKIGWYIDINQWNFNNLYISHNLNLTSYPTYTKINLTKGVWN